jgi:GT2 family glycosyltransferase
MVPLVSIIIITYNRGHLLQDVIRNILQGSFGDFEIIVIDDGSTDGTNNLLGNLINDKKFRYFYQEHSGVSMARNHGIKLSRGRYIAFIDSDIICTKDWLSKLVDVASENKTIGILAAARYNKEYYPYRELIETRKHPGETIAEVSKIGIGASLVKKEVFRKIGGFDENIIFGSEDTELCWRAILAGYKVVYVYDSIVYHFHDRSEHSRLSREKFILELVKNRLYSYLKLMDPLSITVRVFKDVTKTFYYMIRLKTETAIYLKALKWNIQNLRNTIEKRRYIYQNRFNSHKKLKMLENKVKTLDDLNRSFLKEIKELYFRDNVINKFPKQ